MTYAHEGDIAFSVVFFASFAGKKHQSKDIFRSAEGEKVLFAYVLLERGIRKSHGILIRGH